MTYELQTEDFESGLGLGIESTFGEFVNPTVWVPGTCEIEPGDGARIVEMPINEWDQTHVALGGITADGSLSVQVCPGQEALFFGSGGMLARRDKRHLHSFSAVKLVGDAESLRYRGLVVDTWSLKGAREEDLVLDLDVKGVDEAIGAAASPNYASLPAPYILEEMSIWVNEQHRISFDTIELSGEHNLRDDIYGNSRHRQDITTQSRAVSVTLEGWRDPNNALRTAYRDKSVVTLVAEWARGSNWLRATCARCYVGNCNPDNTREPVEIDAMKTVGGAEPIVWTYGP